MINTITAVKCNINCQGCQNFIEEAQCRFLKNMYRVKEKEGQKVQGYYTNSKCISGAINVFIGTTGSVHLLIFIKGINYYTLKFIWMHLNFCGNLVNLDHIWPYLMN